MYCKFCGQQLPNGFKFCGNCGAKVDEVSLPVMASASCGTLQIRRFPNEYGAREPVSIFIDGAKAGEILNDGYFRKSLSAETHSIEITHRDRIVGRRTVSVPPNEVESISFVLRSSGSVNAPSYEYSSPVSAAAKSCPRCGGAMMMQTVTESRKTGCGTVLLYLLLAITILGLFIVIPLMLRRKTDTVTYSVCQSCGYRRRA